MSRLNTMIIIALCLLINPILNAQLSDHLYVNNAASELLKTQKIVCCQTFVTPFENGIASTKYLQRIEQFNPLGQLVSSIDFESDNDTSDYMLVHYDALNRVSSIDWDWYDENPKDNIVYTYNALGQIISECEFIKQDDGSKTSTCQYFHYENDKLSKITDAHKATILYYKHIGNRSYRYNKDHQLTSCYSNGFQDYLTHGSSKLSYTRDSVGNNRFTIHLNTKLNTFSKTIVFYENGLAIKSIEYDELGNILSISENVYRKKD